MAAKYQGANLVIVNGEPTPLDGIADHVLRGSIGQVFSAV
jgi:NAD-dependent SIR2 family protein deacetylase